MYYYSKRPLSSCFFWDALRALAAASLDFKKIRNSDGTERGEVKQSLMTSDLRGLEYFLSRFLKEHTYNVIYKIREH